MAEMNLPEGWVETTLSEIAAVDPKNGDLNSLLSGFIPMALAPTDFNGRLEFEEREWDEIKKKYTHFANGDVIFAKVTPCFENGKAAIVRELPNEIGAGSSEFYVLRPFNKGISTRYIFSIIKSHEFMQTGAANMTGAVGLRRVPRKFVESFHVNLPPPAEQKIIADKLDTLLAQVETTKSRLDHIPQILKTFRQSVLAAAVSGKLTEQWRTKSGIGVWEQVLLGDVIDIGPKKPKCDDESSVSFSPMAMLPKLIGEELIYDVKKWKEVKKGFTCFQNDDVLLAKITPCFENEKSVVASGLKNGIGTGSTEFMVLRPNGRMLSYLILCHVKSLSFLKEGEMDMSGSVGHRRVPKEFVASWSIGLPIIDEQIEIIRRVEELFAFADRIEQKANAALDRVNNLTQSILAKAFRGELSADWRAANPELVSGDNSAEALLEKIKAEREALLIKNKANKKTPKKTTRKKKV